MRLINTQFKGLKLIKGKTFHDSRGFFREILRYKILKNNNKLIFWSVSKSKRNTLRGLHLQNKHSQGKFVSVLKGKIYDVALDLRKKSKTYGKHYKIILSDQNAKSIFIPAGFAHGFLALKKENIIYYTCTNYRSAAHEVGILWNDKDLKIRWPIKNPIISKKDKKNIKFSEYKKLY